MVNALAKQVKNAKMKVNFASIQKVGFLIMDDRLNKQEKMEWRRRAATARDAISAADRHLRSERMCSLVEHHVLNPLRFKLGRALNLCVYAPFRSEASPLPLVKRCWEVGDLTFAPRILPGGEGMELRKVEALSNWIPGRWGVPEPDPSQTLLIDSIQALDVVLVPGIVFNEVGGRLGYGGGYYDRLYEQECRKGNGETHWIGFAFAAQVVTEQLPIELHDLKLNGLVTDEKFIAYRRGEHDG